jgi:hypothetical protein
VYAYAIFLGSIFESPLLKCYLQNPCDLATQILGITALADSETDHIHMLQDHFVSTMKFIFMIL